MADADAPAPDLIGLLQADHRRIDGLLGQDPLPAEIVREIEQHLTAETQLLYPLVHRYLPQREDTMRQLLDVDHGLETQLARLDSRLRAKSVSRDDLTATLTGHVELQDVLFAELSEAADPGELVEAGESLLGVIMVAPTHPHPHLPREGPLERVADTAAAAVDHVRDALRRSE